MALDTNIAQYDAPEKDLYEIGEIPPMGYVPKQMYAWTIRRERHGNPNTAMLEEVVDVPTLDSHEVLVLVMAAGVNYNGVWAALGKPISPFDGHKQPFHIAGSDASGIVWAVGDKVKRWKIGDEVVIHCNQDDGDDEHCNGGDPMYSPSQRIWGYETPGVICPVHKRAGPAAYAAAQAPDLGRIRLLYADAGHGISHAVRSRTT
jgi:crotonyl-CoA carboxylase/reductase